jgi:peptidoglycan/LPS O-acetylase OafA/YrhL
LLHFPIQLFMVTVIDAMGWQRSIFYHVIMLLIYVCLVGGLSLLVYRHFEMPAQAFIKRRSKSYLQKGA